MKNAHPKILVVDDEPDVIGYCQSYFGKRGYFVNTTASGTAAVSLVKLLKPDIMILDRSIPDMNGMQVLKTVRTFDKDIKVVILTGHSFISEKERQELYALNISAYVEKPVVLPDLEDLIQKILGHDFHQEKRPAQSPVSIGSGASRELAHTIKNLLGNLRGQCEVYLLNKEEGIYRDLPSAEISEMADKILKETIHAVDKTITLLDAPSNKDKDV